MSIKSIAFLIIKQSFKFYEQFYFKVTRVTQVTYSNWTKSDVFCALNKKNTVLIA